MVRPDPLRRPNAWHGLDVFHFDAAGKITGKFTYATFRMPLWERAR